MEEMNSEGIIREICRATLWRYMDLCDVPSRREFSQESLAALFTPNATWIGGGADNRTKFGETVGANRIASMLATHLPPAGSFLSNRHLLCGGEFGPVETSGSRPQVEARWLMVRASAFIDGTSETLLSELATRFEMHGGQALIHRYEPTRRSQLTGPEVADALVRHGS